MRILLIFIFAFVSLTGFSQKEVHLKKRHLGSYKGMIPAYQVNSGFNVIDITETDIHVYLTKDEIWITIGDRKQKGTYSVMFKADDYYLVDAKMENELATERIIVYHRGKRISRDGMYPQPVCELKKVKGR